MDFEIINSLGNIGVPTAIIAACFITWMFKTINQKLALASGILTLIIVVIYVPIELFPQARSAFSSYKLEVSSEKVHVFNELGKPTDFTVACKSGDSVIDSLSIDMAQPSSWNSRNLSLRSVNSGSTYEVSSNGDVLGVITNHTLNNLGYVKSSSIVPCSRTSFVASSQEVYPGNQWAIGNVNDALGQLTLDFLAIHSGKAVFTLSSSKLASPKPEKLAVQNKSFDRQVFESNYEVTVQVRSADFTKPLGEQWAAFTVIVAE